MTKKIVWFGLFALIFSTALVTGLSVSAKSAGVLLDAPLLDEDEDGILTLEEMLTYAILDEYAAQATYQAILDAYGQVKPFSKIVLAEQKHIDLLLPLFETYGINVPVNNASDSVVLPDSIASAIATGVEAETLNIAIYESFLEQDLPEDVRVVFEYLKAGSENHLAAFSKDRLTCAAGDISNGLKNMFQQRVGNRNQGQGGQGHRHGGKA
jgi:hypothetical protein